MKKLSNTDIELKKALFVKKGVMSFLTSARLLLQQLEGKIIATPYVLTEIHFRRRLLHFGNVGKHNMKRRPIKPNI